MPQAFALAILCNVTAAVTTVLLECLPSTRLLTCSLFVPTFKARSLTSIFDIVDTSKRSVAPWLVAARGYARRRPSAGPMPTQNAIGLSFEFSRSTPLRGKRWCARASGQSRWTWGRSLEIEIVGRPHVVAPCRSRRPDRGRLRAGAPTDYRLPRWTWGPSFNSESAAPAGAHSRSSSRGSGSRGGTPPLACAPPPAFVPSPAGRA
jgi:hypothetical protein